MIARDHWMSEAEFLEKVGHVPEQDDLERVNCDQAGIVGHFFCGWCDRHDAPMFQCVCGWTHRAMRTV